MLSWIRGKNDEPQLAEIDSGNERVGPVGGAETVGPESTRSFLTDVEDASVQFQLLGLPWPVKKNARSTKVVSTRLEPFDLDWTPEICLDHELGASGLV